MVLETSGDLIERVCRQTAKVPPVHVVAVPQVCNSGTVSAGNQWRRMAVSTICSASVRVR